MDKRKSNEKKFDNWIELENGDRKYWMTVKGRHGWKAMYFKIVDSDENTLKFYQEIYNMNSELVEVHYKYPVDEGHKKL